MKPKVSVILPALLGSKSAQAAIEAWEMQTNREHLEIILLCPDAEAAQQRLGEGFLTICTESLYLHEARAEGIRLANADNLFLAEDHCLPAPDCAAKLVERLAEGWDAVGPVLQAGTKTAAGEAGFLMGYGQWTAPLRAAEVEHLAGHNLLIRRQPFIDLGDRLSDRLFICAFYIGDLHQQGLRFFVEPAALMTHYDPPTFRIQLFIFACSGLGFGAGRTVDWSWPVRGLFVVAFPAVAACHWLRVWRLQARLGLPAGKRVQLLLAAIPIAIAWGIGEAVGAILGRRRLEGFSSRAEVKPVSLEIVAAREGSG
ncbi:MAG: glycosyltransferase [Pirellulaceae bacterium]|nr:glycosyltransferase [Pirellulaceae bacterium]